MLAVLQPVDERMRSPLFGQNCTKSPVDADYGQPFRWVPAIDSIWGSAVDGQQQSSSSESLEDIGG